MIPDNIIEECLESADFAVIKFVENTNIKNTTFDELKLKIGKEYDIQIFNCLTEKQYAHFLKPEDKSDLTTTKIELRKSECLKNCEKRWKEFH